MNAKQLRKVLRGMPDTTKVCLEVEGALLLVKTVQIEDALPTTIGVYRKTEQGEPGVPTLILGR